MNIFKILAAHDGALKEPNITNFLAYLLDPTEDHGLGNRLLLEVLKETDTFKLFTETETQLRAKLENGEYRVKISQEFTVTAPAKNGSGDGKDRDIDILIELFDDLCVPSSKQSKDESFMPVYAICLENKIYESSMTDSQQLTDEMNGLKANYTENDTDEKTSGRPKCGLIYLIPSNKSVKKVKDEFKQLKKPKKIIFWRSDDSDSADSIVGSVRNILREESEGKIDPISETVKYNIRAFLAFVENDFQSTYELKRAVRERQDYGKPVCEYLKEVWESLGNDPYDNTKIKQMLRERISAASGKNIDPSTARCQMYKVTVNERNRIHYGINEPDNDNYNLFYYTNENVRGQLRKFSLNDAPDDTKIYYRNDENESASCTVDELRERKENEQKERK